MAVLFDIDDTLLDHGYAVEHGVLAFHRHFRDRLDEDLPAFTARWRALAAEHMGRFHAGICGYLDQRRARMVAVFEEVLDDDEADARFAVFLQAYSAAWRLFDDVVECLDGLGAAGHAVGLVTNGERGQQNTKLAALGLADRFPVMYCPEPDMPAKPRADIFLAACRALGEEPGACCYIGDHLHPDALAANAAGLRGIWLDRRGEGGAADGVLRIGSLGELAAIL